MSTMNFCTAASVSQTSAILRKAQTEENLDSQGIFEAFAERGFLWKGRLTQ